MPDQPSWLQRVPAIVAELESPGAPPFLDRPAIERLFHVRRRQAIRLLSACGGYQVGRTFLVPRDALLDYISVRIDSGQVNFAVRRKQRILDQLTTNRVVLHVEPESRTVSALPDGVQLLPGLLQVSFGSPVELLEKLFALAQTVSNDFEAFESLMDSIS